jgi:hypothetical protein
MTDAYGSACYISYAYITTCSVATMREENTKAVPCNINCTIPIRFGRCRSLWDGFEKRTMMDRTISPRSKSAVEYPAQIRAGIFKKSMGATLGTEEE